MSDTVGEEGFNEDNETNHLVSIQWGSGPHYFVGTPTSFDKAAESARIQKSQLQRTVGRRGALPKVRVLRIVQVYDIKRNKE